MMQVALITGINGQDGRLLAQLLLDKDYQVHGTSRSGLANNQGLHDGKSIEMHQLQLDQPNEIKSLVAQLQPDEIYHLAARSSSTQLSDDPLSTANINGLSTLIFLDAIKNSSMRSKFCFASSSEIFAAANDTPQTEKTLYAAVNPYGISKHFGMQWISHYRERYGVFAGSAILYNHESIYRGFDYVTRKISTAAARIYLGKANQLVLGSLDSQRDWMHARDAVRGMWAMLQASDANDYVFGSGVLHSVRDICEIAFSHLGLDYQKYVVSEIDVLRRTDSVQLCADSRKALVELGWKPETGFATIIQEMVEFDVHQLTNEKIGQ